MFEKLEQNPESTGWLTLVHTQPSAASVRVFLQRELPCEKVGNRSSYHSWVVNQGVWSNLGYLAQNAILFAVV